MALVYFITHPDVTIDPAVPVPAWPLSPRGRARMTAILTLYLGARHPRPALQYRTESHRRPGDPGGRPRPAVPEVESFGGERSLGDGLPAEARARKGRRQVLRRTFRKRPRLGTRRGRATAHRRGGETDSGVVGGRGTDRDRVSRWRWCPVTNLRFHAAAWDVSGEPGAWPDLWVLLQKFVAKSHAPAMLQDKAELHGCGGRHEVEVAYIDCRGGRALLFNRCAIATLGGGAFHRWWRRHKARSPPGSRG